MNILAIESSCDETAAAVVKNGTTVLSSSVASSTLVHRKYGGIVPEIAAREQIRSIIPVIIEALEPFQKHHKNDSYLKIIKKTIDAIAVTVGPGLIGSLLIGVETAKTIAYATGIPIIPVNHVIAHMFANFILDEPSAEKRKHITFPAISLVVSGGHTELFCMKSTKEISWLGGTLDDAAGEAFDKTARLLGFENRGGVAIQEAAQMYADSFKLSAVSKTITLPRPYLPDKPYSFSFSGLKSACVRVVERHRDQKLLNEETIKQCAFEIQESITDVLVKKTINAAKMNNATSILLSGGVASNTRLREKFKTTIEAHHQDIGLFVPPLSLCTDNAAYIGACAYLFGKEASWHDITGAPGLSVEI